MLTKTTLFFREHIIIPVTRVKVITLLLNVLKSYIYIYIKERKKTIKRLIYAFAVVLRISIPILIGKVKIILSLENKFDFTKSFEGFQRCIIVLE